MDMKTSYQVTPINRVEGIALAALGLVIGCLIALKYRRIAHKVSVLAGQAMADKDNRLADLVKGTVNER